MHPVLINNIPLTTRITYKNIPKKSLNAVFIIERMNKLNQTIWYVPIKIGLSFYLLCSINADQSITFLNSQQILKNRNRLSKIFNMTLINNILHSTMQLRKFNTLLQQDTIDISIHDISSRIQLKTYIESILIKKIRMFFIQSEKDNDIYLETVLMRENIYYISPHEKKSIDTFNMQLFNI